MTSQSILARPRGGRGNPFPLCGERVDFQVSCAPHREMRSIRVKQKQSPAG